MWKGLEGDLPQLGSPAQEHTANPPSHVASGSGHPCAHSPFVPLSAS